MRFFQTISINRVIFCCIFLLGISANQAYGRLLQEDSLRHLSGEQRVKYLNKLAKGMVFKNPEQAFILADNARETARILKLKKEEANAWKLLGNIAFVQGRYPEAIENFQQSYLIAKKLDDRVLMAGTLSNMAVVYKNLKEYDLSLNNYKKALEIFEQEKDSLGKYKVFNNLGVVYVKLKEYDSAIYFYERSLEHKVKINDRKGISNTLMNLGIANLERGEDKQGITYFKKSLGIEKDLGNTEGIVMGMNNLAAYYYKNNVLDSALNYASLAYPNAVKIKTLEQIKESASILYNIHKERGNSAKALQFLETLSQTKEALSNETTAKELGRLESRLQLVAQQSEIDQLKSDQELKDLKIWRNRILVWALIVLLVLSLIFFLFYYRLQRQKHEMMKNVLSAHVQELGFQVKKLSSEVNTQLTLSFEELNSKLINPISQREYEVLQEVFTKKTNKEIAESLHISLNTIKTHLKNLYDKLGVNNRQDAIELVIRKT